MHDSTDILLDDEIAALQRQNTGEAALEAIALRGAAALFRSGRGFVVSVGDLLYTPPHHPDGIEPIDREVQLLTMLTISREWSQLAIHCYWAILVGLHPRDVASTLMLACMWAGIDEYVTALSVFTKVLHILKQLAPTDPLPEDVLAALQKAF